MSVLDKVNLPADLKELTNDELNELCSELRNEIILTVAKQGGHFSSPLGAVEIAVALHHVFESPKDKIVWDVGHQAYAHKLLTGRKDRFHTLRQYDGISGFPKRAESEHDAFGVGHASTSISAALGIAKARDIKGGDFKSIAVIGDGSMTGGLAFEALNNAGQLKTNMLIVLNDNTMSIDPNVGGLSRHMNRLITGDLYNKTKDELEDFIHKLPYGSRIVNLSHKVEEFVKGLVSMNIFFEELGIRYFGPVDGHDVKALIKILGKIKNLKGPVLLHAITQKGKGYIYSERNPTKWHGATPFQIETGDFAKKETPGPKYTDVFADAAVEIAEKHDDIVAITAAMESGAGLKKFHERFPERFFDVGIAEGHAVTFAAGLATEGLHPVCAIYSTFLQRAFDHVVHDVALQNLPVIFALDRGGLVGADGPTHHGTFDLSYLRMIPNMVLMAPKDPAELRDMVHTAAAYHDGPIAYRYPRGCGTTWELPEKPKILPIGKGEVLREGERVAILTIGAMAAHGLVAAQTLSEAGLAAGVINMRFVKPLDLELLQSLAEQYDHLITVEENALMGGFGSAVIEALEQLGGPHVNVVRLGLPDVFADHGDDNTLYRQYGIHPDNIIECAQALTPSKVQVVRPNLPRRAAAK